MEKEEKVIFDKKKKKITSCSKGILFYYQITNYTQISNVRL